MTRNAGDPTSHPSNLVVRTNAVVIGAGQAGLSAAYHLKRLGQEVGRGFIVLDDAARAGGAWQHRWPSLTLSTVNRVHDLPGLAFATTLDARDENEVPAAMAVPGYHAAHEQRFELRVLRPQRVRSVTSLADRLHVKTDLVTISAAGVVNATGTWQTPNIPDVPGRERFAGRQIHTRDNKTADAFADQHIVIVGGGLSAIQIVDEISRVANTTWVTRRPPDFRDGSFDEQSGRSAEAAVEARVRQGLPPKSVVSAAGLRRTPAVAAMEARDVLNRLPMFSEIDWDGIVWPDGRRQHADAIACCTGFRASLDHLAPLALRESDGGIVMQGRLATEVARDPRVRLVGVGPSASTIGANRAGAAAAAELLATLGLGTRPGQSAF